MKGYIRKRGKSSWQIIFDLPRGTDGKRKQARHTVRGTKREAEAKLRELMTNLDRGDYVFPTKDSTGTYLDRWLETYAATNTSPRTQRDYRGIVRRYLIPALGAIPLRTLKPEHVDALYAGMLERGLSARTVLHTHRILKEVLGHAVKRRLLSINICDAVDPPRPERKEMAALDTEGVGRLLEAADGFRYRDVFFVALYTGLRRSEILALRWTEVDIERKALGIIAGLHCLEGQGLVLLATKTKTSRRQIAISEEIVDIFRKLKGSQMLSRMELGSVWQEKGFVFTRPDGSPLNPARVTNEFAKVAKAAGFPGFRLHDLRHTHATLMLKAGVNPKVVSERLGHSSVNITLDTYSHVLPSLQEDAALQFSHLLASREGKY